MTLAKIAEVIEQLEEMATVIVFELAYFAGRVIVAEIW